MEVYLRGQNTPVVLSEVERDDDVCVIGTTQSGKRFVALRNRIREDPIPVRHPYRIYTSGDLTYRVVDPTFEEAEAWLLADASPDQREDVLRVIEQDGHEATLRREDIKSILSAMPEDEAATVAESNGHAETEVEAEDAVPAGE